MSCNPRFGVVHTGSQPVAGAEAVNKEVNANVKVTNSGAQLPVDCLLVEQGLTNPQGRSVQTVLALAGQREINSISSRKHSPEKLTKSLLHICESCPFFRGAEMSKREV